MPGLPVMSSKSAPPSFPPAEQQFHRVLPRKTALAAVHHRGPGRHRPGGLGKGGRVPRPRLERRLAPPRIATEELRSARRAGGASRRRADRLSTLVLRVGRVRRGGRGKAEGAEVEGGGMGGH